MTYFEKDIDYSKFLNSNYENLENSLTKSKCEDKYSKIINMFHDYQEQASNNDYLKERIVEQTYLFRQ
jgi:hypothetical protein